MRPISYVLAGVVGCAVVTGAYFVAQRGGSPIPSAFAQSAGTCCSPAAPITAMVLDGPVTSKVDPASEQASFSLQAVCATAFQNVSNYRTLVVHLGGCTGTVVPQFRSGKGGFVSQAAPEIKCPSAPSAGVRGTAVTLDATLGRDFRVVVTPDAKTGNCPTDLKLDVVGIR